MRALVAQQHGDLSQIGYRTDIPTPTIKPNELLIEIKAAALNRLDLWVLAGWPGLNLQFPHIMGSDGAGIVSQVGASVSTFSVGDRVAINPTIGCGSCSFCLKAQEQMCDQFAVFGEHRPGFYAEYQAVPEQNLLKLPAHISFAEAAAASLVFVTAWHSLITKGQLRPGEDILIVGAGGGVNTATIQIARLAGAKTIYVIGSSEEKLVQAKELGADILINRTEEENWSKAIFKATNRQGVDIVVDNVGAASYHHSLRALKKGGRLLTVGNSSGPKFELDNRLIFAKHLSIIGSTMGNRADYETVMTLLFQGRLKPVIDSIYPLAEGLTALNRLQIGDTVGKLVLTHE